MPRGRPPVPVEVRRQNGNPSGRPLPDVIVAGGKVATMDAPTHLDAGAQDVWNEIVPVLTSSGIVDQADAISLEALCVCVSRAREAAETIKSEGMYVETARGGMQTHPAARVERDSWEMARKLGESFAMTPVARTRLGLSHIKGKTLAVELADKLGAMN